MPEHQSLTPEELPIALMRIAQWRTEPDVSVPCPRCSWEGLLVIDRSARPHAEWFQLTCAGCGLDATVTVPLGAPVPGSLE